jgi:formate-dependent nitrite reductase membrane component NrfD
MPPSLLASQRIPRAMELYRFVLGIVLGAYTGFLGLNQRRHRPSVQNAKLGRRLASLTTSPSPAPSDSHP